MRGIYPHMTSFATHKCGPRCAHTCGEFGGQKKNGAPCTRPSGWGVQGVIAGQVQQRCANHANAGITSITNPKFGPAGWAVGLSLKQRQFVLEFCGAARGNGALAVRLAGYNAPNAMAQANTARELLENPLVRKAIDEYLDKSLMTAQQVTFAIVDLAHVTAAPFFKSIPDPINPNNQPWLVLDMSEEKMELYGHWIKEIEVDPKSGRPVRVKLHDRQGALRDLARIHRLYNDSPQVNFWFTQLRGMTDEELMAELEAARQQVLVEHGSGVPRATAKMLKGTVQNPPARSGP